MIQPFAQFSSYIANVTIFHRVWRNTREYCSLRQWSIYSYLDADRSITGALRSTYMEIVVARSQHRSRTTRRTFINDVNNFACASRDRRIHRGPQTYWLNNKWEILHFAYWHTQGRPCPPPPSNNSQSDDPSVRVHFRSGLNGAHADKWSISVAYRVRMRNDARATSWNVIWLIEWKREGRTMVSFGLDQRSSSRPFFNETTTPVRSDRWIVRLSVGIKRKSVYSGVYCDGVRNSF